MQTMFINYNLHTAPYIINILVCFLIMYGVCRFSSIKLKVLVIRLLLWSIYGQHMVTIFQIESSFTIFEVYHFNSIYCFASHKMRIVGLNLFNWYRFQTKFLELVDIYNLMTLTSARVHCVNCVRPRFQSMTFRVVALISLTA